ncbi:hypothetical protein V496_09738 [Pseudogymnoascus sp. VKM F-4515 (FW-2607)]|nr:hypothetical protein V496_09738 [Pseudogymnoascus sp. VKM F-4515 (FW-2607)]
MLKRLACISSPNRQHPPVRLQPAAPSHQISYQLPVTNYQHYTTDDKTLKFWLTTTTDYNGLPLNYICKWREQPPLLLSDCHEGNTSCS